MSSEEYMEYMKLINEKTRHLDFTELKKEKKKKKVKQRKEKVLLNLEKETKWVSKRLQQKRGPEKRKFNPRFPPLNRKKEQINENKKNFVLSNDDFPSL